MLSKVITIAQQKGGTGKTTLAVNLALAFIKYHNLKVAIIDTDPQGSLGKWYIIRSEKNISNNKNVLIAALLIHAAKIDDNYTNIEKEIIKKPINECLIQNYQTTLK